MSEIIQKLNPLQNTVEQVHVILRKEIIDMRLQPGEAISEKSYVGASKFPELRFGKPACV